MVTESRVIIIDDDKLNNLVCRKIIDVVSDGTSPEVVSFTDPEKGLQYVNEECDRLGEAHCLLLLDINMPVMSGWEFMAEFAKLDECCKRQYTVFIVSSSLDPKDQQRANLDPNVSGMFVKPLSKELMRDLITHPAYAA